MTHLNIKIEELFDSQAPDFQIAKVIKGEIKSYLDSQEEIFKITGGKDFLVKHTKKIDAFIKIIYKYLLRKHFASYLPMSNYIPMTVIALGSYGREQLCIYSDIDIMLLFDEISGFNIKPILEEFVEEKIAEHINRLLKYPLSMQPNIKDGYGGIREANMLFWMAKITYGVSNTKQLIAKVFSEEEYKQFIISVEYLFRIRSALHLLSKKKQDVVNFDILPDLSTCL